MTHDADTIGEIYRALRQGAGRERVTDDNVDALIQAAKQNNDAQTEYLLREWRSECGADPDMPDLKDVTGLPPATGKSGS